MNKSASKHLVLLLDGKTPMATFEESIILAQQKFIGHFTPAA
jgi:hypothetical protein